MKSPSAYPLAAVARLLQLLFAESFLLSIMGATLGAALGVLLAQYASRVPLPIPLPLDFNISLSWRIFAYASLLAILATVLAATAPMWQTRGARPIDGLHGNLKGSHGRRWNLRRVLVTIQVTMATMLLIASGLFLRSLWASTQIHPDFDMENVATSSLTLVAPTSTAQTPPPSSSRQSVESHRSLESYPPPPSPSSRSA